MAESPALTVQSAGGLSPQTRPEFGFSSLVVNQGSQSESSSTSPAPMPKELARREAREVEVAALPPALEASIGSKATWRDRLRTAPRPEGRRTWRSRRSSSCGSSPDSSDGAIQAALEDARQSLRNIKAVDVVSTGLRGENLDEWRAFVRISFLVERVSE